MKTHKICLFDVTPSHYRSEIFRLMDVTFDIHFHFGDMMPSIKTMDVKMLKGNKQGLHIVKIGQMFWYKGMLPIVNSSRDTFIFDGDYRCLSTWIALILCKLRKKRTFLWTHGFYGSETILKSFIKRKFFSLATGGFIYGNYAKKIMVGQYNIDAQKLWVIHNSLDYTQQKRLRDSMIPSDIYRQHFNNDAPVILFIGRLTAVKKLDMILSAQSILKEKGVIINVVYVGDGPEKVRLKKLSEEYAIVQNVWFYGASYEEITNAELIYNADICVSPGNIGLTAIHALSYGTPAITHDSWPNQMPEFEAIIQGKTGDYFTFNDINSLAETIGKWLSKPDSREDIRKACYEVIDTEWNPNYQIDILKDAIENE